jgi:hypothetical protein
MGIVVEIECEVKEGGGDRGLVDSDTRFVEMPSSRSEGSVTSYSDAKSWNKELTGQ